MGLFSWNCKKCGHSIKSPYNIPTGWEYMNDVVYLREGLEPVIGKYDGYGSVESVEAPPEMYNMQDDIGFDTDPELWHKVCWENDGKPGYTGTSDYSSDQGFFYGDPTDEEMMDAIKATV